MAPLQLFKIILIGGSFNQNNAFKNSQDLKLILKIHVCLLQYCTHVGRDNFRMIYCISDIVRLLNNG